MSKADNERLKVWVLSGGRCSICKVYLLESQITYHLEPLGEAAHIVGRKDNSKSPRGKDPLPLSERDCAENLMLVCESCHGEIDEQVNLGIIGPEKLHQIKREHEAQIYHQTGLLPNRKTAVLRMFGTVQGVPVELHRHTAAESVLRSGNRFPHFPLSYSRQGVEIDLQNFPGEKDGSPTYYEMCKATIDEVFRHKIVEGVVKEEISHISVFGFARLPLLVYLGTKLDDTVSTDLYQRHRRDGSWTWDLEAPVVEFEIKTSSRAADAKEGILVLNISGSIQISELPDALTGVPVRFTIEPKLEVPEPDTVSHPETLRNFERSLRHLFATIEASYKSIRKIHVFAASPISAAIKLGQVLDRNVHPSLVVYQRTGCGNYEAALEIP